MVSLIEKKAILHVHTNASDGTGSIEEVIRMARTSGASILGINDHNTLDARERGFGGWNSSLFVLAGAELEDSAENSHLLVYGIDELPRTRDTQEQISFVNESGGIAIAAHPTEAPGKLPRTRSYSWKGGNDTNGLSGVEVWNYMSLWKKGISLFNAAAKLRNPDRYVEHPSPTAIEFWEGTGGCAIAGPDAHALRFGLGRFRLEVFPYDMMFRRLLTHILLYKNLSDSDDIAEKQILSALRRGSCFTSNVLYGDASGFRAGREDECILLRLPGAGKVTISKSGYILWQDHLEAGSHRISSEITGRVSIRVFREGRTWIYCGIP
ncbi:MAG: hypothetical protein K8S24_06660 [Candidatus Aegiribacteria sp.]|nr:hypothetical protein [Candidatus Aegiribacteria sp.]